jgi:DNA-binding beta-propeller fold protein YncE
VIDTATNAVIGSPVGVGIEPDGVAVTPDGSKVYVANAGGNSVSVILARPVCPRRHDPAGQR